MKRTKVDFAGFAHDDGNERHFGAWDQELDAINILIGAQQCGGVVWIPIYHVYTQIDFASKSRLFSPDFSQNEPS